MPDLLTRPLFRAPRASPRAMLAGALLVAVRTACAQPDGVGVVALTGDPVLSIAADAIILAFDPIRFAPAPLVF